MDKLRAIQVFVRIVESGSLTAAATALDVSVPSVVRTLAALEQAVGVRLLNRTTRRSSLSDEGREYYERCRQVLAELDAADAALSARRAQPKGRLRITAPVMYGRLHVAPVVNAFMARYPAVEVELLLLDLLQPQPHQHLLLLPKRWKLVKKLKKLQKHVRMLKKSIKRLLMFSELN